MGYNLPGTLQHKISERLSIQPGIISMLKVAAVARIKKGTVYCWLRLLSLGEWKINHWLQMRPRHSGGSQYRVPSATRIPSINTKIKLNDKNDLRLAYGRGFRAPSLRELYFNFMDANHNIIRNDKLEAEFSDSFTMPPGITTCLKEIAKTLTTVIGGFYNNVTNMIGYTTSQSGGIPVTTYTNIDHFKSTGPWNNLWKSKMWDVTARVDVHGRYNQYSESVNDLQKSSLGQPKWKQQHR